MFYFRLPTSHRLFLLLRPVWASPMQQGPFLNLTKRCRLYLRIDSILWKWPENLYSWFTERNLFTLDLLIVFLTKKSKNTISRQKFIFYKNNNGTWNMTFILYRDSLSPKRNRNSLVLLLRTIFFLQQHFEVFQR